MRITAAVLLALLYSSPLIGAQEATEVKLVDNRLTIQAREVPLERLLQLIDSVTGMKSSVPSKHAARLVSVKCTDLELDEAIKKVFEGLGLNYIVVRGKAITVTGVAQPPTPASPSSTSESAKSLPE